MSGKSAKALRKFAGHHPSNAVTYVREAQGKMTKSATAVLDPKTTRSRYQILKRNGVKPS